MRYLLLITLPLLLSFNLTAADTPAARAAYETDILAKNVTAIIPGSGAKENELVYRVGVLITINAAGILAAPEQRYAYIPASDSYALLGPVRANYTAPAPTAK